jgi:DNA recombination protein RmuC
VNAVLALCVVLGLFSAIAAVLWARAVYTLRSRDAEASERLNAAAAREEKLAGQLADQRVALAVCEERVRQCDELREECTTLRETKIAYEKLVSASAERDRQHEVRAAELEERFSSLAQAALERSHLSFVERAEETLRRHREAAGEGLKENAVLLNQLISPMKETLVKYEQKLEQIELARANAYGAIENAISEVQRGQEKVQSEAAKLTHALRNAPKARGRWGEHQLKRVLEMAGLMNRVDFAEEVTVDSLDGRLRPDAIVNLPGDRVLVIDAKCSLGSYQDAMDSTDDAERATHLKAHAAAIRAHVAALSRRAYWDQFKNAPDFVIMFIPGENFLAAALEHDQELFESAFNQKILLASPTNLIAIARTVAMVWRQEQLAVEFQQIAALGKELHDRIATMGAHVAKTGKALGAAAEAYNQMVGSLETQVMTSAQRFRDLSIETPKKIIEPLPPVDCQPRTLGKLVVLSESQADDNAL